MIKGTYLNELEKTPSVSQIYSNSWADYIELVCLANVDGEITEDEFADRIMGRIIDLKEDSPDNLKELEELESQSDDQEEVSNRAKIPEKIKTRVRDYFNILALRQNMYGSFYPFQVSEDFIETKQDFDDRQLLYIYLLMCSNLHLFDSSSRTKLANCFELISFNAFRNLLPDNASVHLFGKNPYNTNGEFSRGSFWRKLNRLKDAINEQLNPHLRQRDFSGHNTGDEGLDLVAWIPTGDRLSSSLIYFAQCACTYDFVSKQHTSSHYAWAQKLVFKNPPSNSTFIPHCFRGSDGKWINSNDIAYTYLMDRIRILKFYEDNNVYSFSDLPVFGIVKEMIALKEKVF
jgi:hypothetical protein